MSNIKITNKYIASLNPCKTRHDNYLLHYKNTNFSIVKFLQLENITYDDKIWVWKKFATINEAAIFGLKCASSVLDIFEAKYPKDKRSRLALEAVDTYIQNPTVENKQKCRDAAANAVYAAVYAANAADAADAAANAAADAADAAVYAANAARQNQKELNLIYLVEIYT